MDVVVEGERVMVKGGWAEGEGGRGWDGRADWEGGRMRVGRVRDGQWGGVAEDHSGCPVRCCSGASLSFHFIHIHSHVDSSLLLKRVRLACLSSPGSSAQDHRAHLSAQDGGLYEHHDTRFRGGARIRGGADVCLPVVCFAHVAVRQQGAQAAPLTWRRSSSKAKLVHALQAASKQVPVFEMRKNATEPTIG